MRLGTFMRTAVSLMRAVTFRVCHQNHCCCFCFQIFLELLRLWQSRKLNFGKLLKQNFLQTGCLGTQEIRFGRKMNKIAKFSILDEKRNHNFGRKMANWSPKRVVKFFLINWLYHNAFTVGWKNGCLELLGCERINLSAEKALLTFQWKSLP